MPADISLSCYLSCLGTIYVTQVFCFTISNQFNVFNVHGSVHRNNILIYIQQDATLDSIFYLETALHVSGGTSTHHEKRKQLYLQHLVFVTPLLLPAAIVEELELLCSSNSSTAAYILGIPTLLGSQECTQISNINHLNPELNPICYLLALLGAHHFLHVSRIRVKSLIFRRLMSYIYGAPILDVSRSHTTTQHSR